MNTLRYILQKEFLLIFRDRTILRLIFIMPLMQLILIPMAADYEVKHVALAVVDHDQSSASQQLTNKLGASHYFRMVAHPQTYPAATELAQRGQADVLLTIPRGFERDLVVQRQTTIQLAADAVNGVRAGLGMGYATAMIRDFAWQWQRGSTPPPSRIEVSTTNWYNPHIYYPMFMVPGILVILVTMVGSALTAVNIVTEKENGTIEQINVSPISKTYFILGKLIPFWVLGMISLTLGMIVARVVYGLLPSGAFSTIYLFGGIYLVAILGIGLFISTISENQQQATLFSFFLMMVFVLLGGLYTPIESMPSWAQTLAAYNPPSYFIMVIRAVYIKGATLLDLLPALWRLIAFALLFNALAILNYRKRSG